MQKQGVNMAHFTGRLLEKIEELTLYTLQQEKALAQQEQALQQHSKTMIDLSDLVTRQSELLNLQSAQLKQLISQVEK